MVRTSKETEYNYGWSLEDSVSSESFWSTCSTGHVTFSRSEKGVDKVMDSLPGYLS